MRRSRRTILGLLVAIVFGGGSVVAKEVNVYSCERYDVEKADLATASMSKRSVIMLEFDDGGFPDAQAARASLVLQNAVENLLNKSGTEVKDARLIDNQEIRSAIQRYELDGTSEFSTTLATDAVSAKLTDVTVTMAFNEAGSYTIKGETIQTAAYCRHTASIQGVFNIYSVNPLQLLKSVNFKDSESINIEGNSRSCQINEETRIHLVKTAIDEAIMQRASSKIYSLFRSVGFVREVRKCGKYIYVWISTLPSRGAIPGAVAKFFSQETYVDPYSNEVIVRKIPITSGKLVKTPNPNEAWVKLKKAKDVQRLQIGHLVEIEQKGKTCIGEWCF